jgi:Ca2+-binding EF-hand superfamily protein
VWALADINGDGHVDGAELTRLITILIRLGVFSEESLMVGTRRRKLSPAEFAFHVFAKCDENRDAVLSKEEFAKFVVDMMKGAPRRGRGVAPTPVPTAPTAPAS